MMYGVVVFAVGERVVWVACMPLGDKMPRRYLRCDGVSVTQTHVSHLISERYEDTVPCLTDFALNCRTGLTLSDNSCLTLIMYYIHKGPPTRYAQLLTLNRRHSHTEKLQFNFLWQSLSIQWVLRIRVMHTLIRCWWWWWVSGIGWMADNKWQQTVTANVL